MSRRSRVANFADIVKIRTMFIKTTFDFNFDLKISTKLQKLEIKY